MKDTINQEREKEKIMRERERERERERDHSFLIKIWRKENKIINMCVYL